MARARQWEINCSDQFCPESKFVFFLKARTGHKAAVAWLKTLIEYWGDSIGIGLRLATYPDPILIWVRPAGKIHFQKIVLRVTIERHGTPGPDGLLRPWWHIAGQPYCPTAFDTGGCIPEPRCQGCPVCGGYVVRESRDAHPAFIMDAVAYLCTQRHCWLTGNSPPYKVTLMDPREVLVSRADLESKGVLIHG